MNLDEAQKKHVAEWIEQGLKLSDIQQRIEAEFGVRMTYLDVRLLVDDLKVIPKDIPREKAAQRPSPLEAAPEQAAPPVPPSAAPGQVSVTVDAIARPGAVVSGSVAFSDGNRANWYLDQMGRLGIAPEKQDYKPSAPDLQAFQSALQKELEKMGF